MANRQTMMYHKKSGDMDASYNCGLVIVNLGIAKSHSCCKHLVTLGGDSLGSDLELDSPERWAVHSWTAGLHQGFQLNSWSWCFWVSWSSPCCWLMILWNSPFCNGQSEGSKKCSLQRFPELSVDACRRSALAWSMNNIHIHAYIHSIVYLAYICLNSCNTWERCYDLWSGKLDEPTIIVFVASMYVCIHIHLSKEKWTLI